MSTWRSRKSRESCTVDDLIEIIKAPSGGAYVFPTQPYNEVYPGIFIGDAHTAMCTGVLRSLGINHVVNAAHSRSKREGFEVLEEFDPFVRTTEAYYTRAGIRFFPVPAIDLIHFRLAPFFRDAADFIDDALSSGGKVLVHCKQGISRSSTLVVAFLMLKRGMTVQEALTIIRSKREVMPNEGFLQQLCDLNERLARERQ